MALKAPLKAAAGAARPGTPTSRSRPSTPKSAGQKKKKATSAAGAPGPAPFASVEVLRQQAAAWRDLAAGLSREAEPTLVERLIPAMEALMAEQGLGKPIDLFLVWDKNKDGKLTKMEVPICSARGRPARGLRTRPARMRVPVPCACPGHGGRQVRSARLESWPRSSDRRAARLG